MLDLSHPRTEYIFQAARIEDEIRKHLVAMRECASDVTAHRYQEIHELFIPMLKALNAEHFGKSKDIDDALDRISAAAQAHDLVKCSSEFYPFADAPGANFGTWAI